MSLLINIFLGLYVFIALLMILVILMQRPKSEGLGAAFGGGVTENIFGAQTTNVLTKFTGWLAAMFFLLTFALSILYAHKGNTDSGLRRELMKSEPPAATTTASPSASPGPSSAVSPSGTVTSPTPASTSSVPASTSAPATTPAPASSPAKPSAAPTAPASTPPKKP
jgi:preprotein translocase subunit SecG